MRVFEGLGYIYSGCGWEPPAAVGAAPLPFTAEAYAMHGVLSREPPPPPVQPPEDARAVQDFSEGAVEANQVASAAQMSASSQAVAEFTVATAELDRDLAFRVMSLSD